MFNIFREEVLPHSSVSSPKATKSSFPPSDSQNLSFLAQRPPDVPTLHISKGQGYLFGKFMRKSKKPPFSKPTENIPLSLIVQN